MRMYSDIKSCVCLNYDGICMQILKKDKVVIKNMNLLCFTPVCDQVRTSQFGNQRTGIMSETPGFPLV